METVKKFSDLPHVDKKIIEGIPWAQEMWKILENGLNKCFLYWCQLVLNMGESDDVLEGWVKIFIETYEQSCCDLVCDMEHLQRRVIEKIEQLLHKTQHLCRVLQIEMPSIGNQQLSLYQEQSHLKKRVEEYEKIIEIRRHELNELRKKQLELCNSLGQEPKILNDNPLPSAEEIEEFQKHIEKLESEKFNRLERFFSVKEELLAIVDELKISPSSQFEREVFCADDSAFLVTDSNMKELDRLQKGMNKHLKTVKEDIAHLRAKIDDYWNLLDCDLKEREEFRQKHKGNSIDVLEALKAEVKRCEQLKKANIKVFIDKLRAELKHIWEKCHCSQGMKEQFNFFYSDCYNEDLLELHEMELKKWKKYYEENKELLLLLERHKRLWNKMVELEENATGPNRYNNRGGQLLKEEKERNKLSKMIPQIEDTLQDLAQKYELRYNKPFISYGETVDEYIANLHEDRENTKKQKLSARKLQREKSNLTPAKSVLNLFPSTSHLTTPHSTTKRKLGTPLTDVKKKPKMASAKKEVLSERKDNNIKKKVPVPTLTITSISGRSKRFSSERKKRLNKIRRQSAQKAAMKANVNETFSMDYGDFQNELSTKGDCRSTILPSEALAPSTPASTTVVSRKTPTNVLSVTSRTPGYKTPTNIKTPKLTPRTPKTPDINSTKLSRAKSNLKLIF